MVEAAAGHSDALSNDDVTAGSNYTSIPREFNFQYWKTFLLFATMGAGASWVQLILPASKFDFLVL